MLLVGRLGFKDLVVIVNVEIDGRIRFKRDFRLITGTVGLYNLRWCANSKSMRWSNLIRCLTFILKRGGGNLGFWQQNSRSQSKHRREANF